LTRSRFRWPKKALHRRSVGAASNGAHAADQVEIVKDSIEEASTFYRYADNHWVRIRTNKPMEEIIREIRRRTRVVGAFPGGLV